MGSSGLHAGRTSGTWPPSRPGQEIGDVLFNEGIHCNLRQSFAHETYSVGLAPDLLGAFPEPTVVSDSDSSLMSADLMVEVDATKLGTFFMQGSLRMR